MPRYRFQDFVLSPRQRTLLRNGRELSLIPRYFDLLVFLIERRHQAVHRRDIFDHVWRDVVVSDSALSQAIRTIRRVLDDDSREPRFVRTVSRHGYRFVFEEVIEEEEEGPAPEHTPEHVGPQLVAPATPIVLPGVEHPRWLRAAIGGGGAGLLAGAVGAVLLASVPDSRASMAVVPVLTLMGGGCGAAGAAAVTAGLSFAESRFPSRRAAIVAGAALGGGMIGLVAQLLGRWTLQTMVGLDVPVGGLLPGVAIGAACGVAYLMDQRSHSSDLPADALVDPETRPPTRIAWRTVALFAALSGMAALALVLVGQPLVGGTLHAISQASAGAQTTMAPLAHLLGEQDFGPLTAAIIGTGEGLLFGAGLGLGLSYRRR